MNVTGVIPSNETALTGKQGLSLIARRQQHTLFTFSTDLTFNPQQPDQEAGISVFLTQINHIDLSIAHTGIPANTSVLPSNTTTPPGYESSTAAGNLELRLRVETAGTVNTTVPYSLTSIPMPASWYNAGPIRLQVHTPNHEEYTFTAFPASNPNDKVVVGTAPAYVVTRASGQFTGTLLGAYATCNGAGAYNTTTCRGEGGTGYFGRWRYTGAAQEVDFGTYVTSEAN